MIALLVHAWISTIGTAAYICLRAPYHSLGHGLIVSELVQVANALLGKKVIVGSGLDRVKLDQIRRLSRRLRANACKAVDHDTTHLVVQV